MPAEGERPNGLRERIERIERQLDEYPPRALHEQQVALRERQDDQKEDLSWLKRALWGLVFAVILAVATYFIRLGAAPPAG